MGSLTLINQEREGGGKEGGREREIMFRIEK